MSGYAIVNLREVEDSAPKFGFGDRMQARFPREQLGSDAVAVSLQRVAPNARQPFAHRHGEQEEIYVVLSGSVRVRLGDDELELAPYDTVRIPPGMKRGFQGGPDGGELLAFGAPNTENKDAEVLPGWWGD